jgi:hypothetical protein
MKIPQRMVNRREARQRFGDLVDRMGHWLRQGDPLADELIAATRGWSRGRLLRAIDTAVCQGTDAVDEAPDELYALMEQVETVPAWVDRERIDHGAEFFLSTHLPGGIVLGAKSLILGYAAPAGNKPLMLSGRLNEGTHGRLAETSRFVYDVSQPGGLAPGADGIVAAVTVRLIHAHVRDMIDRKAPWDDAWGVPINQHDMLATLLLFSNYWQDGLETLGLSPRDQEKEDHIALWRYVGYLMGVDPELLPTHRAEADRYARFIELTQAPPDDDARTLTNAFLSAGPPNEEERTRPEGEVAPLPRAVSRTLLGQEMGDQLGIEPSPLSPVVRLFKPVIAATNSMRKTGPGFRAAVQAGHRYWQHVLHNNPDGLAEFTLHEELLGLRQPAA